MDIKSAIARMIKCYLQSEHELLQKNIFQL
mgnify:CR=1 FL=1